MCINRANLTMSSLKRIVFRLRLRLLQQTASWDQFRHPLGDLKCPYYMTLFCVCFFIHSLSDSASSHWLPCGLARQKLHLWCSCCGSWPSTFPYVSLLGVVYHEYLSS